MPISHLTLSAARATIAAIPPTGRPPMLKHLFRALPLSLLGIFAATGSAIAAFDPTRDELSVGAFVVAICLMAFLALVYGAVEVFGISKPEEVEIPDHAHDHRYAGHH